MNEREKHYTIADQFAQDWLIVAMNDADSYAGLMSDAVFYNNTPQLSDKLREEWEQLAEQVTELVEERLGETASLFIAQMLKGQGSLPFDIIAREAISKAKEIN